MKKAILTAAILFHLVFLAGCEFGYTPPVVPVRISISTSGDVNVELSPQLVTPIGTFDISGGTTVYSFREQYAGRVLIVRVDNQASIYELAEGREFRISFDDENTLYKKVALEYETDGDIVLEFESMHPSAHNSDSSSDLPTGNSSCPGAEPQRVTVGTTVRVCTKSDNLILRDNASPSSDEVFRIPPGTEVVIVNGPSCADDSSWWQVEVPSGILVRRGSYDAPQFVLESDTIGWVREGSDSIDPYFLCAIP